MDSLYQRHRAIGHFGLYLEIHKSTVYAHEKYPLLLRDFQRIHTYNWGQHLSIFIGQCAVHHGANAVCIAPVPRQYLSAANVPVTRW
ncbi:hypothetical protein AHAS_Ahas01G0093800 [Arachis hypogaea]